MDHWALHSPWHNARALEVQDYHWATAKQLQEMEETWSQLILADWLCQTKDFCSPDLLVALLIRSASPSCNPF